MDAGNSRSLEEMVSRAADRITRLSAPAARSAAADGAVLIDIRSHDARARDGVIPGSLHIPRTVLEWRVALDSPWRNPSLGGRDQCLILVCDHGYSSILAARNLVALGFANAGDVVGGFESWAQSGQPISQARALPDAEALPGMSPPEAELS